MTNFRSAWPGDLEIVWFKRAVGVHLPWDHASEVVHGCVSVGCVATQR